MLGHLGHLRWHESSKKCWPCLSRPRAPAKEDAERQGNQKQNLPHHVAKYFVSLWPYPLYQSWIVQKSMIGFMIGSAISWLVGWSWLINHGGVGVRTQMTFKSCLFWCWWNPHFFFQRGVTKTSWFCSYLFARPKPLYVGKLTTRCNTAKKNQKHKFAHVWLRPVRY